MGKGRGGDAEGGEDGMWWELGDGGNRFRQEEATWGSSVKQGNPSWRDALCS